MKTITAVPIKSPRVTYSTDVTLEGGTRRQRQKAQKVFDGIGAIMLRSASRPGVRVLEQFDARAWNEDRMYRAWVLRAARRSIAERLRAEVSA